MLQVVLEHRQQFHLADRMLNCMQHAPQHGSYLFSSLHLALKGADLVVQVILSAGSLLALPLQLSLHGMHTADQTPLAFSRMQLG